MTENVMERVARALFAIDPADPWKGLTTVSWAGKLAMASDFLERLNAAGLVVVPREPTEAMLRAGWYDAEAPITIQLSRVYAAMLAAGKPRLDGEK